MQIKAAAVVVDHDSGVRNLLETFLESAGYRVYSFASPKLARLALTALGDDASILICELDCRGLEGLRMVQRFPRVPVVLTSAWGELPEAARNYPALLKPFRPTVLMSLVSKLVKQRYVSASAA